MQRFKLFLLLFILLCLQGIHSNAQKIKLVTISIEEIDNKLVIKYDIVKGKENQLFNISLVISGSSGNIISIKSLKGDIGENIPGGHGKTIIWDYNADGIVLQDNINLEIFAEPIMNESIELKTVSTGKALFLSTILPGLGLSKTDQSKPYWLMGVLAYGSLGYSYLLNKKALDNYDSYLANTDEKLNDGLLSDSQSQNKLSKTMAYTAIGIWGINLVWTTLKAKNCKNKNLVHNKKNFDFIAAYDPFTKTLGMNLKLKF
jgi:hypothetical protein